MQLRHLFFAASIFALSFGVVACVDHEFDEPPVANLPGLTANATIAQVKALYTGSADVQITEDWVLEGVVAADDESGNFYQQIIVQDATGGFAVRMSANGLFGKFPVGSQVFIKAKGLYISEYNGFPQLNGSPGEPIEELLIPQYVIPGIPDKGITATPVTLAELNDANRFKQLLSTLVEFTDVQFADASASAPYADVVNRFSVNHAVEDCNANSIILRTSGYADFGNVLTPEGKGKVTAILSVFRTDKQLIIRTTDDVQMAGPRCGGGSQGGEQMSVAALRALYTGVTTAGPVDKKIKGVVISDRAAANIVSRNLVVQDGDAGIAVRFAADHSYNLGDEIEINVGGVELSEFNGLVQLNNVPNGNASRVGAGTLPTPRLATIGQINANGQAWESTLVQIVDATLSGAATYNGTVTVADASGSIPMFTRASATFSGNALPTSTAKVTAIVSDFNGLQLNLRNAADVEASGSGGSATLTTLADLREAFVDGATSAPANRKIRGIIISDRTNLNTTDRNVVIQDGSGGIVVRFTANHSFALGEDVEIVVSGMELSEFNGLLQLNNVPNANAVSFGPGTLPTPRTATLQQVVANKEAWESTLVRVSNVTFTDGGTYSGSKNLSDGTGTIILFTRSQATFAGSNVPTGAVTVTGVVSDFSEAQLFIRNLTDVQ